jgi:hypothetical protein
MPTASEREATRERPGSTSAAPHRIRSLTVQGLRERHRAIELSFHNDITIIWMKTTASYANESRWLFATD